MKKIIILILTLLLYCSIVFATDTEMYFKKNDFIDINIECSNNGFMCSPSSLCNLTMYYPNGSIYIQNRNMTRVSNNYNFTISGPDILGDYQTNIFCCDGLDCYFKTFIVRINNSGKKDNETGLIGIFIILFVMTFAYLYSAFNVDESHFNVRALLFFLAFINLSGGLLAGILTQTNWFNVFYVLESLLVLNGLIILILAYYYIWYLPRKKLDEIYD